MTGIAPVEGYAVGFYLGSEARKTGQPRQIPATWSPDKQHGYEDGWQWAGDSKADPVERALIDDDYRDHRGDLRYEPPSAAARALALNSSKGLRR